MHLKNNDISKSVRRDTGRGKAKNRNESFCSTIISTDPETIIQGNDMNPLIRNTGKTGE